MNWYKKISQNIGTFKDETFNVSITGPKTYIRFGDIPKENSFDYARWEKEVGVSVYEAIKGKDGKFILMDQNVNINTLDSLLNSERIAYEVSGTPIGEGADGEPVLDKRNISIIGPVDISKLYSKGRAVKLPVSVTIQ